jgi:hypothetical protein
MVLISRTKHVNKINSMLSLSSKALYCTSSKCTNRKTTPRMVSSKIRHYRENKFQTESLPQNSRRWEEVKIHSFGSGTGGSHL